MRREWETGAFHPQETVLVQNALAILQQSASVEGRRLVEQFEETGITAAADEVAVVVQRQPADAVPAVLNPTLPVAQIPDRIRLMVLALTRYFWNVPLSRLGLWLGVSKSTVSPGVIGLAAALFPAIQTRIVRGVQAVTVAIDETWLKLQQPWHYRGANPGKRAQRISME